MGEREYVCDKERGRKYDLVEVFKEEMTGQDVNGEIKSS